MQNNILNNLTKKDFRVIGKQYSSTIDWKHSDPDTFIIARELGYLAECTKHMEYPYSKRHITPTIGDCYRDAILFDDEYTWKEQSPLLYKRAYEQGWMRVCDHMFNRIEVIDYTFEECLKDATKYRSKVAWRKSKSLKYQKAYIKGWVNKCFRRLNNWSIESCLHNALQYKTKEEWKKSEAFLMSIQLGCFEICTAHMVNLRATWLEEDILKDAAKYQSTTEWESKSSASYSAAKKLGVFLKASAHMFLDCSNAA